MDTPTTSSRPRVWVTTPAAAACPVRSRPLRRASFSAVSFLSATAAMAPSCDKPCTFVASCPVGRDKRPPQKTQERDLRGRVGITVELRAVAV
jgi:hypothetical protein